MTGRMEVVGRVSGWRRWSDAAKLEIFAEAFRQEVRIYDVIARREVSSSLIYTRRKQLREGKLAGASHSLPAFAMDEPSFGRSKGTVHFPKMDIRSCRRRKY